MDADSFDALFTEHVVAPTRQVGFEPWGKALRWEHDSFRLVVLRTELRSTWPFAFTLVAGHAFLRDFKDRQPAPWSRDPSEYPIKCRPSDVARLTRRFNRYHSFNLGKYPQEFMTEPDVAAQLAHIGSELARYAPTLPSILTPQRLRKRISRDGENAWCERRWIEDYQAHTSS